MATVIGAGYSLDRPEQGFERDAFDTLTNMLKYSTTKLPDIFETLVISNGRKYRYQKSNANIAVPSGATEEQLQGLKELRKWRLVEEGGGGSGSGIVTANTAEEMASLTEDGAIVFFTGDDDSTNGFFHGDVYRYETDKWNIFDGNKKNSSSVEDWNEGDIKVYTGPDTDTLKHGVTYTCTGVVPHSVNESYIEFVPVTFGDASTDATLFNPDYSTSRIYYKVANPETDPVMTAMSNIASLTADTVGTAGEFIPYTEYADAINVIPIPNLSDTGSNKWVKSGENRYTREPIMIADEFGDAFDVNIGMAVSTEGITNQDDVYFIMLKASDGTLYAYNRDMMF